MHLENLRQHEFFQADSEAENAIRRSITILKVSDGDAADLPSFSFSEQIRILAVASSALCLSQTTRAIALFEQALFFQPFRFIPMLIHYSQFDFPNLQF